MLKIDINMIYYVQTNLKWKPTQICSLEQRKTLAKIILSLK